MPKKRPLAVEIERFKVTFVALRFKVWEVGGSSAWKIGRGLQALSHMAPVCRATDLILEGRLNGPDSILSREVCADQRLRYTAGLFGYRNHFGLRVLATAHRRFWGSVQGARTVHLKWQLLASDG